MQLLGILKAATDAPPKIAVVIPNHSHPIKGNSGWIVNQLNNFLFLATIQLHILT
jgi:hypothetical protein